MKKISSILFVLLLMLASFTAGTQYPRGDVDYNGKVNIADVVTLIDYLLTGTWEEPLPPDDPQEEHEWVDLGLPSGTLWATCNVGASAPEQYGDYFAWGETEPKDYYDWSTYKWCNGEVKLTKYCTFSDYGYNGFTDNKTELDPEDDAACINWGPSWRMPTYEQVEELYKTCSSVWTTQNGVNGRLLTGPNGNTMFLPAAGFRYDGSYDGSLGNAGFRYDGSLNFAGSWCFYWSRTLSSSGPYCAFGVCFYSGDGFLDDGGREYGYTVRAVRVS